MTREEYRNHVHTMVDLVLDIKETGLEHEPTVTMHIYSDLGPVEIWVHKGKSAKQHTTRCQKERWDTPIEKLLEMLQEIKAELDKKKSSATDQSKTELN